MILVLLGTMLNGLSSNLIMNFKLLRCCIIEILFLYSFTKLPVILKGILTKEDAILAAKTGCKGIIVSNHGGRQLDDVQATVSKKRFLVNFRVTLIFHQFSD